MRTKLLILFTLLFFSIINFHSFAMCSGNNDLCIGKLKNSELYVYGNENNKKIVLGLSGNDEENTFYKYDSLSWLKGSQCNFIFLKNENTITLNYNIDRYINSDRDFIFNGINKGGPIDDNILKANYYARVKVKLSLDGTSEIKESIVYVKYGGTNINTKLSIMLNELKTTAQNICNSGGKCNFDVKLSISSSETKCPNNLGEFEYKDDYKAISLAPPNYQRLDVTGNGLNEEFKSSNYSGSNGMSLFEGINPKDLPNGNYSKNGGEYERICNIDPQNDDDCDSIPNSKDICPDEYGSAYFLGCPNETILIESEDKELTSCTGDQTTGELFNAKGSITFDEKQNTLNCTSNGLGDNYFVINGFSYPSPIENPPLETYHCYNEDIGGDDHIDTCTLESQNVQTSVFDLDLDGKKYYSQKWISEFEYDNKNGFTNEDDCPASYGTDLRGCPVINQEDVTVEDDKITFEDEAKNKIAIDENSHIYINDQFIATYTPFTKSVNVNVQNSCIPTVRFSKLAKTNKDIKEKLIALLGRDLVENGLNPNNRDERLNLETAIAQLKKEEQQDLYSTIKENLDCDTSYTRQDSLTPQSVLLALHHLNPVDNATKTLELINDAMNTTSQLDFSKTITPKETDNSITTQIDLNIENIPANTTIWQIIPKENAPDIEELLKNTQLANATQLLTKDKDPIIGWYFKFPVKETTLTFEIIGTGEGGVTLPLQNRVYYNFGELIVNYRDAGCFDDEKELFTTTGFDGRIVEHPQGNPLTYSVCIAHNGTEDITDNGQYSETHFSIRNGRINPDVGDLATDIPLHKAIDTKYYEMQIGEYADNPGYSCIGSLDENGLFADCIFNPENRLWIYYGPDPYPPEISLSTYVPAETIAFEILFEDRLSGVNEESAKYCITNSKNETCELQPYVIDREITTSCPTSAYCIKYLHIEVYDNAGNRATAIKELTLLEKLSACTSECLGIPTPGRYINSCNNINGCTYYALEDETEFQKGESVSNLCHFMIEGSWVQLGNGLEVKCPNGPTRPSRYTQQPLLVESDCSYIHTQKYPVLLEGEEVTMNIMICND